MGAISSIRQLVAPSERVADPGLVDHLLRRAGRRRSTFSPTRRQPNSRGRDRPAAGHRQSLGTPTRVSFPVDPVPDHAPVARRTRHWVRARSAGPASRRRRSSERRVRRRRGPLRTARRERPLPSTAVATTTCCARTSNGFVGTRNASMPPSRMRSSGSPRSAPGGPMLPGAGTPRTPHRPGRRRAHPLERRRHARRKLDLDDQFDRAMSMPSPARRSPPRRQDPRLRSSSMRAAAAPSRRQRGGRGDHRRGAFCWQLASALPALDSPHAGPPADHPFRSFVAQGGQSHPRRGALPPPAPCHVPRTVRRISARFSGDLVEAGGQALGEAADWRRNDSGTVLLDQVDHALLDVPPDGEQRFQPPAGTSTSTPESNHSPMSSKQERRPPGPTPLCDAAPPPRPGAPRGGAPPRRRTVTDRPIALHRLLEQARQPLERQGSRAPRFVPATTCALRRGSPSRPRGAPRVACE